jgi:transcriptional regulator with XRE-family HTH domain
MKSRGSRIARSGRRTTSTAPQGTGADRFIPKPGSAQPPDKQVHETGTALPDGPKISLAASVGKEVKSLRLARGMTAQELAAKARLSKGMLSRIESGAATPSFSTLSSLSASLGVPVARLFAGHVKREDFSLVRARKGIQVQRRGPTVGLNYELLGHLLSGESQIEPYLVTISDSAAPGRGFQHPGVEFIYILRGAMQYRYADSIVELYPGDSLVFDPNAIHGHERLLETPVEFLSVVVTNRA